MKSNFFRHLVIILIITVASTALLALVDADASAGGITSEHGVFFIAAYFVIGVLYAAVYGLVRSVAKEKSRRVA